LTCDGKIKLYLFLLFTSFYLLSSGDHYTVVNYSTDELIMMVSTYALVNAGSLRFNEVYGQTASKYGVGQTLVAVPFFIIGDAISKFFPDDKSDIIIGYFLYAVNAVITSLLIAAFYGFSRYLRYPIKTSFYSSAVLGLCTICFPYARMFFMHPLTALLLLFMIFHLTNYARRQNAKDVFLSGLFFALLLLTRIDTLVIIIVIIPYYIIVHAHPNWSKCGISGRYIKDAIIFFFPVIVAIIAHLIINYLKFGAFRQSGYEGEGFTTTLSFGLYGLLFSPSRSIFLYSPPLILCLMGLVRFFSKRPILSVTILSVAMLQIFFFAKWHDWHGGLSWGPRYLLPLVPLCMLFINEIFLRFQKYSKQFRGLIIFIILAGLIVQLIGVLTSFSQFNGYIFGMVNDDENQFLFIPQLSGIAGHLHFIRLGKIDSFLINFTQYFSPVLLAFVILVFAGGIIISFVNLKRLVKFRFSDFIISRRSKEWRRGDKVFAILALLNIFLFISIYLIISSNSIIRRTQVVYQDARIEERLSKDVLTCIDESKPYNQNDIKSIHISWRGKLRAPLSGDYSFYVKVHGKYLFQIDGAPIMELKEFKGQVTTVKRIRLEKGYHDFCMDYQPYDPCKRLLHLYATFPGFGHYKTLLSNKYIFPKEPPPLIRFGLFLDQFKGIFIIVSILILLYLHVWENKYSQRKESMQRGCSECESD